MQRFPKYPGQRPRSWEGTHERSGVERQAARVLIRASESRRLLESIGPDWMSHSYWWLRIPAPGLRWNLQENTHTSSSGVTFYTSDYSGWYYCGQAYDIIMQKRQKKKHFFFPLPLSLASPVLFEAANTSSTPGSVSCCSAGTNGRKSHSSSFSPPKQLLISLYLWVNQTLVRTLEAETRRSEKPELRKSKKR